MRVIAKKTLREFWEKHRDRELQLRLWHDEFSKYDWTNFNDIKEDYPSASILWNQRLVFNIKRNRYGLVAEVNFNIQTLSIRFIGSHAEYDRINAKTI